MWKKTRTGSADGAGFQRKWLLRVIEKRLESKCDGGLLLNLGLNAMLVGSGYEFAGHEHVSFYQFALNSSRLKDPIESFARNCNNAIESSPPGVKQS